MSHPSTNAKRIPGRTVVLALVSSIALVLSTAVALFFLNREPEGTILAMCAAPGGRAVVLRKGFEARDTVHVAVYDVRGRHLWSEALFGVQRDRAPLAVGGRVVVPARDASGRPETQVFGLDDGRFAFRTDPPPASVPRDATARYAARGGTLFELYAGDPGSLAAYDLSSGRRLHAASAPPGADAIALVGSTLVVSGGALSALDSATFEPAAVPIAAGRPAARPGAPSLRAGCFTWAAPSGTASIDVSALGEGPSELVEGEGATVLRIGDGRREVTLAAVDPGGELHVARVRSTGGSLAPVRPEHVGTDALFLRTRGRLVGLRLPELAPPDAPVDGFETTSATRAPTGCGAAVAR